MTVLKRSSAAVCAVVLLAGVAPATPDRPAPPPATVTEVRDAEDGKPSILIDIGERADVRPGQTVEVRREGRAIGYGAVEQVFATTRVAVATVGTLVGGATLRAGDQVRFRGQGFSRAARSDRGLPAARPKPEPEPEPEPEPAEAAEPPKPRAVPVGKVVSVLDGLVLVALEPGKQVAIGDRISLRDEAGRELGRIAVELLGQRRAGGPVLEGAPRTGARAVSLGPPERRELDFVALDFLGVVADIEHAVPHEAACHLGVPVWRVVPGSPAERGGIGRGDRVVAIDGYVVSTPAAIRERVDARTGPQVRVVVLRGGRLVDVDVAFGE